MNSMKKDTIITLLSLGGVGSIKYRRTFYFIKLYCEINRNKSMKKASVSPAPKGKSKSLNKTASVGLVTFLN